MVRVIIRRVKYWNGIALAVYLVYIFRRMAKPIRLDVLRMPLSSVLAGLVEVGVKWFLASVHCLASTWNIAWTLWVLLIASRYWIRYCSYAVFDGHLLERNFLPWSLRNCKLVITHIEEIYGLRVCCNRLYSGLFLVYWFVIYAWLYDWQFFKIDCSLLWFGGVWMTNVFPFIEMCYF